MGIRADQRALQKHARRMVCLGFLLLTSCANYGAQNNFLAALLLGQGSSASSSGTPGVRILESSTSTAVSEASGYDFYSIVLNSAPSADVTVSMSFDGTQIKIAGDTVSPRQITFTPSNWSTPQVIVVRAVNDTTVEGAHSSTISHSASSTDASYNGSSISSVVVQISDNDSAGVTINESGGSTDLTEGSGNDAYTVVLTRAPTANVVVSVAFDSAQVRINGSAVSPVQLTFTTANWFTQQTITVTAVNDGLTEGSHASSISHSAASADASYNGVSITGVSAGITDINGPGVSITESGGSTSIAEAGATDTYDVVLTAAPSSNVTVNIQFDSAQITINGSSVSPVQLTFTPGNWSAAQTVTAAAVNDSTIEGTHSSVMIHSASSADASFNGLTVRTVVTSITDNDITPIVAGGVQTGVVATTGSAVSQTITAVDTSRAFVMCYFTSSSSNMDHVPTCQISSSTQITIEGASGATVRYYVMEFASGASVQRGSFVMGGGAASRDVTLSTAVDLSKSFAIAYARTSSTPTDADEQRLLRAELTSTTNLRFTRGETGASLNVEWQVIQLEGAQVQAGTASIANGATSVVAPLGVFDTSSSFLISNYSAGDVGGAEASYLTTGNISSATSLTFTRQGSSQQIDISYFLVEMVNGPKIQQGTINVGATSTTATATLSPVVNTSFTMPLIAFNLSDSDDASIDSGFFRPSITAGNTLQVDRFNTESKTCRVDWYTIELTSQ